MQRGAKIALASGIVLSGLIGASLFRKPPKPAAPPEDEPPQLDRLTTGLPPDNPYAAARLSDQIDPVAAAEPPPAADDSDGGASPLASDAEAQPQSDHATAPQSDEPGEANTAPKTQLPPRPRRTHLVRDGDTLSSLADEYLGSSKRYLEIYEANRELLASPDLLPIGAELQIPSPDEVAQQPVLETPAEPPMSPLSPRPEIPSRPPPPGVKRSYRVKAGDTLVAIARQFYGDGERYQEIYEANRERLRAPEDLREGLVLDIP